MFLGKTASVQEACVVGVDLGGTNVRARAYQLSGEGLGSICQLPSQAGDGQSAVVEAIATAVEGARNPDQPTPRRVGIAVPGHIDDAAGLVRWAPNFRNNGDIWRDVPLKQLVENRIGLPVVLGNDANLAALGEYRFGSGRNSASCLVMLTLGTGVGGGVVLGNGSVQGQARGPLLLLGGNKGGAELGHLCINRQGPNAGNVAYGALEAYCSARAVVERTVRKLSTGTDSSLRDHESLTPKLVSQAAEAGDPFAIEVWTEVGEHLGTAIGGLINIFAPDVVAIGGQMALAGAPLMDAARRVARDIAIPTLFADADIVIASRVADAGLLGAAALAIETNP